MDGNRRWAKQRGLPTLAGHKKGVDTLKKVGHWCIDRGIRYLTVWAFSTENWSRPKKEVSYLMKLIREVAINEIDNFLKKGIRLNILGRLKELPDEVQTALQTAMAKTKDNTDLTLNVGVNYGGRAEIVDAVKDITQQGIAPDDISEDTLTKKLYHPEVPDVDMVIRTSGEQRSSGFMLWRAAYAEYHYCKSYWPAFSEKDLDTAIDDYAQRQRRFGGG